MGEDASNWVERALRFVSDSSSEEPRGNSRPLQGKKPSNRGRSPAAPRTPTTPEKRGRRRARRKAPSRISRDHLLC